MVTANAWERRAKLTSARLAVWTWAGRGGGDVTVRVRCVSKAPMPLPAGRPTGHRLVRADVYPVKEPGDGEDHRVRLE